MIQASINHESMVHTGRVQAGMLHTWVVVPRQSAPAPCRDGLSQARVWIPSPHETLHAP